MAIGDKSADEAGPHVAAAEKDDILILHNVSIISMFAVQVGTDPHLQHAGACLSPSPVAGAVAGGFGIYRVRGPNNAVPILIMVAPSAMAARISLVVPMDKVSSR